MENEIIDSRVGRDDLEQRSTETYLKEQESRVDLMLDYFYS